MKEEKTIKPSNGYLILFILLISLIVSVFTGLYTENLYYIIISVVCAALLPGLILVNPNTSKVILLFGEYKGTIKTNGLYWANPLYKKKTISLRASNFDSERLKVNDKLGNPVMISTILVWRVTNTYKAAFDVDN